MPAPRNDQRSTIVAGLIWPTSHALSSLKDHKLQSIATVFVLSLSLAIPTTVFIWTSTGMTLASHDYFQDSSYQIALRESGSELNIQHLLQAQEAAEESIFVESTDLSPTTIGIVRMPQDSDWHHYRVMDMNYAQGLKDTRVIFVDSKSLDYWSREFIWEGEFSLSLGEVLVSNGFASFFNEVYGIPVRTGMEMSFDLLRFGGDPAVSKTPEKLGKLDIDGLRVAGIFDIKRRSMLSGLFSSIHRKNWDPFEEPVEVLGLTDAVIMLQDQVREANLNEIRDRGFFPPRVFIRTSEQSLLRAGVESMGANIRNIMTYIEEEYPTINALGVAETMFLDRIIAAYSQSRILTVAVVPLLVMSLVLSVLTSDISVRRRKREVSTLRAKGASYNQILATFLCEASILSVLTFIVGIALSVILAPLIDSRMGLLTFNPTEYLIYWSNLSVPWLSLALAGGISLVLPTTYLVHVSRNVAVFEIGQPMTIVEHGATEEHHIKLQLGILVTLLTIAVVLPTALLPAGVMAVAGVAVTSGALLLTAYYSAQVIRCAAALVLERISFLLGEKSLYLSRSLRRRKGHLIPLLAILNLTLSAATIVLVQSASLDQNIRYELQHAIGADVRVQVQQGELEFERTLLAVPGVYQATPIFEVAASAGSNSFFLEGIVPDEFLTIAKVQQSDFIDSSPEEVLTALSNTCNGIVVSSHYADTWNVSVGEDIDVSLDVMGQLITHQFQIVGVMRSAPGLGMAATADLPVDAFVSLLGFQVGRGGFALVNQEFLTSIVSKRSINLFFVRLAPFANHTRVVSYLDNLPGVDACSIETLDWEKLAPSVALFLSGLQGLSEVMVYMAMALSFACILLFLTSAIYEKQMEYATFRALGGTRRHITALVFGEFAGNIMSSAATSIIIGSVFGYAMTVLTFGLAPFKLLRAYTLAFPLATILPFLFIEFLVMVVICYLAAQKAMLEEPGLILRNL